MEENGMKDWEYVDDEEMSIMMRGNGDINNNNNYNYDDDDDDKGMRGSMILRLGKKVVIAGVVMSSLPVVVPPLIVMSALGCAVSLPFGLVLASYAAADKLMSRLLGGGYVAVDEYDDYKEDVEEEEEEERVVEMTAIEISPPPFDQIRDNGGGVSSLEDQKQGDDQNGQPISLSQDEKESRASDICNEEDQNIDDELMGESKGDDQNGQLVEQTSLEVEGKPIIPDTKDAQASNILNEAENKRKRRQGKRNNSKASKLTTKRSESDDDKKSGLVNVTSTAQPEFGPQLPQDVVLATGNIDSSRKTQRKPEEQDVAVHDESNVINDEISTSEIAVDVPIKDGGNGNQSDTIAAADGELKNDQRVTELKEEKDATALDSGSHSSEEGLIGEEMFWKKMNAIRAIVGYKAPKRDSYIEELKALYLFTGIEPPTDSAEFHYKLSFLMSVIGLK